MKRTPPLIAPVITAALALATAPSGVAQPTAAELLASLRAEFGEGILFPDPVVDAPFSAEALTVWHPPASSGRNEWRATARHYRDRAGRVRVEQVFVGQAREQRPQRVIVISDPHNASGSLLDSAARTVRRISRGEAVSTVGGANSVVMPISMTRFIGFPQPQRHTVHGNTAHGEESLGQRFVAGIETVGTRLSVTWLLGLTAREVETTQERWISPELKLMVFSRTEDSLIGNVEHRLTNISRTEPPAALFTVPTEYRETELAFSQTWENPYVLVQQHPDRR